MTNKYLIILIIILIPITIFVVSKIKSANNLPLAGASLKNAASKQTAVPTPTPAPTPIRFDFNSQTDLNKELNSVDPKVEENDFSNLP